MADSGSTTTAAIFGTNFASSIATTTASTGVADFGPISFTSSAFGVEATNATARLVSCFIKHTAMLSATVIKVFNNGRYYDFGDYFVPLVLDCSAQRNLISIFRHKLGDDENGQSLRWSVIGLARLCLTTFDFVFAMLYRSGCFAIHAHSSVLASVEERLYPHVAQT